MRISDHEAIMTNQSTIFSSRVLLILLTLACFSFSFSAQNVNDTKVKLGSNTAKNGFKNEDEVRDKFNDWKTDIDAQAWLVRMNYKLAEIESVSAAKPHGEKADVEVRIKTKAGERKEGISIKLVTGKTGFNQIDKRWLSAYARKWRMPADVETALKFFLGELPPTKPSRKPNRMFLNELEPDQQKAVIDFFTANKAEIVKYLFAGEGPHAAGWLIFTYKSNVVHQWTLRSAAETIKYFSEGKVEITPSGNLKIGRVFVQRKGGDAGAASAMKLQFKIHPTFSF